MFAKDKALDDIARIAGGTVSIVSGLRQETREEVKSRIDALATRLDLVPREDFENLETRLNEMKEQLRRQDERIRDLENQIREKV